MLWVRVGYGVGVIVDYFSNLDVEGDEELVVWDKNIFDFGRGWFGLVYGYCNWEGINIKISDEVIDSELSLWVWWRDFNDVFNVVEDGSDWDGYVVI